MLQPGVSSTLSPVQVTLARHAATLSCEQHSFKLCSRQNFPEHWYDAAGFLFITSMWITFDSPGLVFKTAMMDTKLWERQVAQLLHDDSLMQP